ncbi:MAG: hypothetical protein KBC21_02415 [Candidatus Pacebacteria bacterium]|nr:hypothetical protein [Candidatus Paceibacterota bacterium]
MIIGFLGKGGSGKTTLASGFALFLSKNSSVLAIDADHNMDMTYNLAKNELPTYIGAGLSDINKHLGITQYRDSFDSIKMPEFTLSPEDAITKKYAHKVTLSLKVMSTGPHTDEILYDKACSHSLATPLKVYLPFLNLKENEYVVVDEKAGTDGVGTGITTGFHAAVVVAEPTPYGLKAALQIIKLLNFYKTPYFTALNKVASDEDILFAEKYLDRKLDLIFFSDQEALRFSEKTVSIFNEQFNQLKDKLEKISDTRLDRTKEKIKRNTQYSEQ